MSSSVAALACLVAAATGALAATQLKANQVPGTHWGYAPIDKATNASLFYWMFEAETDPANKPLVLWLTGGPGCSSELALFFENGPFTVNPDLSLKPNPHSWTKVANVIWLDQPVGTGFSLVGSGSYVRNETQVAADVHTALKFFLTKYPQYAKMPFFVTGESYGGHYVSSVSERVSRDHSINFKGLAIGNGWVDPEIQYQHYVDQAIYGGIISSAQAANVNGMVPGCVQLLKQQQWGQAFQYCSQIVGTILNDAGNINPYNMHQPCEVQPLCYNMKPMTEYLNQGWVQEQLGVDKTWSSCSSAVYPPLAASDWSHSFRQDIVKVLERGFTATVYEGVLDLMCGFTGATAYLESMPWAGQHEFVNAKNQTWTAAGKTAGSVKQAHRLTYFNVMDAGHMVPHDQPAAALEILTSVITGKLPQLL